MPLQLIEFLKTPTEEDKDSSTIKIKKPNLEKVLEQCGDRPLCIICICGPSRQGKSFILGHIIRCFDAVQQERDDWMDWGNPRKPLDEGFTWQNAYGPVTQGIWIWEKPFVLKSNDGKECAVLLIDTQGTYDEFTSNKDMTAIVGLSLLMSSVMIFNFFTNLQEDILSSLSTYIEYGLIAVNDAKTEKPFQKLKFLIRDWNNPTEFEYGKKGGAEFIKKKLEIKDNQPESAQKVRQTIKKCFQDMSCFLMPAIGDKALAKDYDGNIAALNRNFAKKMEEFVTELSDQELVIKKILGSHVTAKELVSYMDTYVETFNKSTIPSAMSMWEATTLVANNALVEKAKKAFQEKMRKNRRGKQYLNPGDFETAKEEAEDEALVIFRQGQKYGDNIQSFEDSLKAFIENEAKAHEADNQAKRMTSIEGAQSEAKEAFKEEFSNKFELDEENFWEEEIIIKTANYAKQTAFENFREQLEAETKTEMKNLESSLEKWFDGIIKEVKLKNALNQNTATTKLEEFVDNLIESYKMVMKETIENGAMYDETQLLEAANLENEKIIKEFDQHDKPGGPDFHKTFKVQLTKKLVDEWESIGTKFKLRLKEFNEQAEDVLCKLVKEYKDFLEQATKPNLINMDSENERRGDHEEWLNDQSKKFQEECPFLENSSSMQKFTEQLTEKLNSCLEHALTTINQHNEKMQREIESLIKSHAQWYQEEMLQKTKEYLPPNELQEEHDRIKLATFKRFVEDEVVSKSGMLEKNNELLETSINECWERIVATNEKLGELLLTGIKNEVHVSLAAYKNAMHQAMEQMKFESGKAVNMDPEHEKCYKMAQEMLREKTSKLSATDLNDVLQELQSLVDKAYPEVKKMVELKELELKSAIRDVLDNARRYYHGEMGKIIDHQVYMQPDELKQIHDKILKVAVTQFGATLEEKHKAELKSGLELSFLKYRDENHMKYNMEAADIAIGIDLGTTYCCVAAYYKGQIRIIKNSLGFNLTPSYLTLCDDGTEKIGELAKKGAFLDAENTIYDAKRMIGRKWTDEKLQHDIKFWPFVVEREDGLPKIRARGNTFYPEQISAKLLKHLKNEAEQELQKKVSKVVITVPAYFTDGQRQATVDAGEIAGFNVLEILNEPTAAAIAYKFQKINDNARKVLIYDLGGGTFDVAVLEMKVDEINVLAVDGDTHLGGEDFDKSLMEYCAKEFQSAKGIDLFEGKDSTNKLVKDKTRAAIRRLQTNAEDRKKDLAQSSKTDIVIDNLKQGEDLNVTVSRSTFESLNMQLFEKTLEIVDKALASAGLKKNDIDDIVLVGGSTRILKIQSMLKNHFGGKRLNLTIHPDEAVAYGAAVRAAMLNGASASSEYRSTVINDVTPMSIGVEIFSGELSVIIKKGSKFGSVEQETYSPALDYQTSILVRIFQGEERMAVDNELLGEFELTGIPPNPRGVEKVVVKMNIDKMGLLKVNATSKSSGSTKEVIVKSNKGRLSEDEKRRLKEDEESRHNSYKSSYTDEEDDGTSRDYVTDSEDEGELWSY